MLTTRYRPAAILASAILVLLPMACSTPARTAAGSRAGANLPTPMQPVQASIPSVETSELSKTSEVCRCLGEPAGLPTGLAETSTGPGSLVAAADDTPDRLHIDLHLASEDCRHHYSLGNLAALGLGVGLAAPLANTSADEAIRRWYERRIRGETTDEFANIANYAGQFWVVLPVGLELAALLGAADDPAEDSPLLEWSNRSLRSLAVGAPPMIALYAVLGSSRPDRNDSHWRPFHDVHGVSGHTFVGAVPFLTAAAMTDDLRWQMPLVAGSFLTGWSRINNDRHYFSQMMLGWWMAYLAVRSVDHTNESLFSIVPAYGEGPGAALQLRY